MPTIIDKMFEDHKALLDLLASQKEISLASDADNKLKKVLLLSAASYFEFEIASAMMQFAEDASQKNVALVALVKSKAVKRQFHTYFQWDRNNANSFFGLLGEDFSSQCKAHVREQEGLEESIRAFLELGNARNEMVHENFATFPMDKTAEEVYELYRKALQFVLYVQKRLREASRVAPAGIET
jgi:hypothetical protein